MLPRPSLPALALSAVLAALAPGAGAVLAGSVQLTAEGYEFTETFAWQGNHAATINGGLGSTVWWDEASWDVRGDTATVSISASQAIANTFHVDIHRAASGDPQSGALDNTLRVIGGDGSPGVGVMHLDYQDILDARLRNPLVVGAERPGVIEFYASSFVHTGHWWEIALTPAATVTGGELTSVPGQGEAALPSPTGGGNLGPGHRPPLDAINLVAIGASDVPCITGFRSYFAVTRTVGGATSHFVTPQALGDLPATSPALADTLIEWRVVVTPSRIELHSDPEDDGSFAFVDGWNVAVPWREVFVHLLGVAYQSDHHPQPGGCHAEDHLRELRWRDVRVFPVRWAGTDVTPKNDGADQVPKATGWMAYDLRDIQRFGAPIAGAPQPNTEAFSTAHAGRYCNHGGYPCFVQPGDETTPTLTFTPPVHAGTTLAGARLLADLKRGFDDSEQLVEVALGGSPVGAFSPARLAAAAESSVWVRRGLSLPVASLAPGTPATLDLTLGPGTYVDRLEVELYYAAAPAPPSAGLAFHTLSPCRLVDTRLPFGSHGGPAFAGDGERFVPVTGRCGIPASAKAVAVNLTAVDPTAPGQLAAYPAGIQPPGTSIVSFVAGRNRASSAVVRLDDLGAAAVRSSVAGGQVHVVVDVTGWFE